MDDDTRAAARELERLQRIAAAARLVADDDPWFVFSGTYAATWAACWSCGEAYRATVPRDEREHDGDCAWAALRAACEEQDGMRDDERTARCPSGAGLVRQHPRWTGRCPAHDPVRALRDRLAAAERERDEHVRACVSLGRRVLEEEARAIRAEDALLSIRTDAALAWAADPPAPRRWYRETLARIDRQCERALDGATDLLADAAPTTEEE